MPEATPLRRLKRRPEFLRVQHKGRRWATPGLVLQACPIPATDGVHASDIGFGLTASKKVGNAVHRNRARRRLRALATERLATLAKPGVDYVLIARQGTLDRPWPEMQSDLAVALKKLKKLRRSGPNTGGDAC